MAKKQTKRHPGRVIEDYSRYLLRLSDDLYYYQTAGDGKPLGVRAPSIARHMSYVEADTLCQRFRSMGYQGPVVTDIFGRMIDGEALAAERRAQDERARRFWGE